MGGFAIRFYAIAMRTIINPDGAQYLYQASAIYNHHWSNLFSCKLNYISPLPIFIASSFAVFKDWIIAGQAVSLLFGTATLLPLYHLVRRFTNPSVCVLTLLIYALIPVFVDVSGDILKGPLFWFFSVLGMLTFVRQFDEDAKKNRIRADLVLSCFFFIVAAWCRIEGVMYLVVSPVYLLISPNHKRIERYLIFTAPLVVFGLLIVIPAFLSNEMLNFIRMEKVFNEITSFASKYDSLKLQIKGAYAIEKGIYGEFLHRAREVLFLIPLLSIAQNLIEGLFYPFSLIYFIGFIGLRQRCRKDPRVGYFLLMSLAAFFLLYIHMVKSWIITHRFMAILFYSGFIIMANGIETVIYTLMRWRRWRFKKAVLILAVFLLLASLPKNLKPTESDKAVYLKVASIIADQKQPGQPAPLYTTWSDRAFEWVLLYSHRQSTELRCSKSLTIKIPKTYEAFKRLLDRVDAGYFFYESRKWPQKRFDLLASPFERDFRRLGQWHHPDSGELILFKRKCHPADSENGATTN